MSIYYTKRLKIRSLSSRNFNEWKDVRKDYKGVYIAADQTNHDNITYHLYTVYCIWRQIPWGQGSWYLCKGIQTCDLKQKMFVPWQATIDPSLPFKLMFADHTTPICFEKNRQHSSKRWMLWRIRQYDKLMQNNLPYKIFKISRYPEIY